MDNNVSFKEVPFIPFDVTKFGLPEGTTSITLASRDTCSSSYLYESFSNMQCNYIRVKYSIDIENTEMSSRYSDLVKIEIGIKYYDGLKDQDGNVTQYVSGGLIQNIVITPYYNSDEDKMNYTDIAINGSDLIESIEINIINNETSKISVGLLELYQDTSVNNKNINNYTGSGSQAYELQKIVYVEGSDELRLTYDSIEYKFSVSYGDNGIINKITNNTTGKTIDINFS